MPPLPSSLIVRMNSKILKPSWLIFETFTLTNLPLKMDEKIAGTEALFADVGHFSVRSIQISMCTVTYPALVLAYTGQASYLRKHHSDEEVAYTFYKSIPRE